MSRLRPNPDPAHSLIAGFGGVVDGLRQLQTNVGMRPYRVFAVVVRWSGGEVGRGDPVVETEVELLPTPMVRLRGIRFENRPGGKTDRGYLEVSEISPRYTEAELLSSFHVKPLTEAHEAFYEVVRDNRDGAPSVRRRFVLRGMPDHDAENFMWVLKLSAQDKDRSKSGKPARAERVWRK
jgi:hypothetical protein